jgi:dihydrodipicolinate synthase/N-acetylneuraminate lyase
VRAVLDRPDDAGESNLRALRSAMEAQPFIAAIKHVLRRRGLPIGQDLRAPLRALTREEATRLDASLAQIEAPLAV